MASNNNKVKISERMLFVEDMERQARGCDGLPPRSMFVMTKENKEGEVTSQKFDHNGFAKWLINDSGEDFVSISDIGSAKDSIYRYEDGIYKEGGGVWIEKMMEMVMDGEMCTIRSRSEVIGHIRAIVTVDRDVFDNDDDVINMDNGLYNISSGKLRAHTPEYYSLSKIAVVYDEKAECPTVDRFLRDTLEPNRLEAGYEIMGYAMMPRKRMKKSIILVGPPNSGKGTYMRLMASLVGADQVTEINPITIVSYTHATEVVVGKLVLRVDDLGETEIVETGLLKSIISSERMHVNIKGGKQFDFWPRALMIFGCNKVPECSDPNLMDKFDILECKNGRDDFECDTTLDNEFVEEMSGLFNKAMEAVKTALRNNKFTGGFTLADRRKMFLYMSNPAARFADEFLDLRDLEAMEEVGTIRKAFVEWSKSNGMMRMMQQKDFTVYLKDQGCIVTKIGGRGEQVAYYKGVSFRINSVTPGIFSDNQGVDSVSPFGITNPPIKEGYEKKKESIIESYDGRVHDTNGENGIPIAKTTKTTETYTGNTENRNSSQQSKRLDLDQSTYPDLWSDPNAEQKLKHAVGKAIAKNNRPDVDVVMIDEAHAEHPGVSMVVAQLNDRGDALGITRNAKGLYRITI